jgi:hypothetical protein
VPNSSLVGFSGFWIGSTVGAVALLVLAGMLVASLVYGRVLGQMLDWLSPLFDLLWIVAVALGVLLMMVLEEVLSLLLVEPGALGSQLRELFLRLSQLLDPLRAESAENGGAQAISPIWAVLQVAVCVAIPAAIILLVVLYTWHRGRRGPREEGDELRESLLSAGIVGRSLQAMLQAGKDRLSELVGLVDRFGLGSRFLSAVTIRRIYANLLRLAAEAGYPRAEAQTPHEYLETLHEALPGSEADVATITEAYVNARYGQVPDTREELQRIRDCWERVRTRQLRV